ncbi:MAG: imidazolonepropionase-like amidohydrolase [Desulforhopalus sp.]|jgi:imidazolonepropionase-like amidohydrolase
MSTIKTVTVSVAVVFFAFASLTSASSGPKFSHTGPTIITNVAVIDGLGNSPVSGQDITLVDGKIAAIGATGRVKTPSGALKIDGTGMTAMPGLMDLHIHTQGGWGNGLIPGERYKVRVDDESVQQRLSGYVYSGVTTVMDVGGEHDYVLNKRKQINGGELFGPRYFTTGIPWSQSPSGWDAGSTGASGGSVKVNDLAGIPKQMARYKAEGIEIIKLYAGLGSVAMQAIIEEAHKHDILTIADLWMLNMNRPLMQTTGLDGWAHSAPFAIAPKSDHEWMAKNNRFVIATANVGEKLGGMRVKDEKGQRLMLKEPLIVDIWGKDEVNEFYDVYPQIREGYYEGPRSFYQSNNFGDLTEFRKIMNANIKASFDAGVLVACGTDDIYASMWPGESTHREMELYVMAGVSNLEAIKACTYNAAKVLRRDKEFGSLQIGLSADLLLVQGDPSKNIDDTRNVQQVFMRGKQVDRDSLKLKK